MKSTANPLVFTKLELILQRLLDSIQQGYTHVASGQEAPSKSLKLASKFDIQYQVFADKNLRARRKRNALSNARWLCFVKQGDSFQLTRVIRALYTRPRFRGLRSQVGKLVVLADDCIRLGVLAEAYQQKLDGVKNHV